MPITEGVDALQTISNSAPQFFTAGMTNGTATAWTTWYTNNAVATAPFLYIMVVDVDIQHGFNAAANQVSWGILDEGGVSILHKSAFLTGAEEWRRDQPGAAGYHQSTFRAIKTYSAGATCGFRLVYKVSGSNVWCDASVKVTIYRA